ncbi:hypothetical protein [Sulfolobus acidocaldarius]|uniref:hypothetical protein n=1 Tax=Sulfolobus acidocaldarius TaxID=2285 RepID=UPI000785E0E8|nr:hypothetical protein [Sulfolobus acidocaldarius]
MELEKSMIVKFTISPTALIYMTGMMLLDSVGLYFALSSVKNLEVGAIWYSSSVLLLSASISAGFSNTLIYQSSSLAYLIRFSKLKLMRYVISLLLGVSVSVVLFSLLFGGIIAPLVAKVAIGVTHTFVSLSNIVPFTISALVAGFFIVSLTFLVIVILLLKVGARASNYVYIIFLALLVLTQLSPQTSSLNPIFLAEDAITHSVINQHFSPYILELLGFSLLLSFLSTTLLRRLESLRLEEEIWK